MTLIAYADRGSRGALRCGYSRAIKWTLQINQPAFAILAYPPVWQNQPAILTRNKHHKITTPENGISAVLLDVGDP